MASLVSCTSARGNRLDKIENVEEILDLAESGATASGRKILEVSRSMIANQDVFVGGCWNYINAVYDRAGYSAKQRDTIYKSKFQGPYVNSDLIQSGDWLYFVNHSFSESEHSAIFVTWLDEDRKEALMVNYIGGSKKRPGTYKRFIIDEVYNIIRAKE